MKKTEVQNEFEDSDDDESASSSSQMQQVYLFNNAFVVNVLENIDCYQV